ncbi:hypothetical protein QAD02_014964 [Eretmocerus hayati]|uniref:Uncharacterized protein n=1 Tax=Eretmocerus hayati TaxID=131215 RepID=A0ACC2P7C1_9HYME|nr:hypothetical protein QAD02_014964 [Eretmocerus hayati]
MEVCTLNCEDPITKLEQEVEVKASVNRKTSFNEHQEQTRTSNGRSFQKSTKSTMDINKTVEHQNILSKKSAVTKSVMIHDDMQGNHYSVNQKIAAAQPTSSDEPPHQ